MSGYKPQDEEEPLWFETPYGWEPNVPALLKKILQQIEEVAKLKELKEKKMRTNHCDVCKKEISPFRFNCSIMHNHFAPAGCQIRPETTELQLCLTCSREIALLIGQKMGIESDFYGVEME